MAVFPLSAPLGGQRLVGRAGTCLCHGAPSKLRVGLGQPPAPPLSLQPPPSVGALQKVGVEQRELHLRPGPADYSPDRSLAITLSLLL